MELVDNVEEELKKLKDEQQENIKNAKDALNTEVPTNIKNKNRLKA